ncbi:prolipoprotein diacylglyceryl transferase [Shimia haliotis]|uniref:Phosphatidylglycerol--prolipoprotein diacylglyceryl transferase n=1 Tax=Shimia haliotis TaxID=1280847 RepID=A0A1I4F465_9RHOB|nr:prolipoprotein diacylglyceryl transferase [Shimia haliotis]SFL12758.1 Prolipoprotein diacylglyceryl transferase [Shimia haliotis]
MRASIMFPEISPEIFSITVFGMEFALRWYALAYIVGILIGWRIVVAAVRAPRLWPNDEAPINPRQIEDLLTWVILGVILGGRLGYILFYKPAYYAANPAEILQIWQGGMAFHGGMLGVIVAAWLYTSAHKLNKLRVSDAMVLGIWPGLLLGRIANFINAELWGRQTEMPWGVIFPGHAAQDCGQLLGLCARHPSQLYEAAMEGLILGALLLWLAWRRGGLKRSGLLSGVFFAGYGAARFIVEFFRQPDAHFVTEGNPLGLALHLGGYGFTMGQLLSLPMILIGGYLIARAKPA